MGRRRRAEGAALPTRTVVLITVVIAGLITSCAQELNATTSCRDFLQASSDEQSAAVARVADELSVQDAVGPLGQANITYLCGNDGDMTLGQAVEATGDGAGTVEPEDSGSDASPIDQDPIEVGVEPDFLAAAARQFNEAQKSFYSMNGAYTLNPRVDLPANVDYQFIDLESPSRPDVSSAFCVKWIAFNDSGFVTSTWLFDSDTGWYFEPPDGTVSLIEIEMENCP